ncbi:MAG: thiol:disulfide interchange protein DsbA/DsbL [Xanthomonadaceae bacterium]|nr:thiol:disulfide interchange protein DsbA/DsbL [Xanthomonadaceae bacterium]
MTKTSIFRLLLCAIAPLLLAFNAQASVESPVAGQDYHEVAGHPTPLAPLDAGQVEVVTVFGYTCPHCAAFEMPLEAWQKKQPDYVRTVNLPAPFGRMWNTYARAYYAAQSLGILDRSHDAVFEALHVKGSLPRNPSDQELGTFYASYGVSSAQFVTALNSAGVAANVQRAEDFVRRTGTDVTPTLVINGKYRIPASNPDATLRIANWLIAREHNNAGK